MFDQLLTAGKKQLQVDFSNEVCAVSETPILKSWTFECTKVVVCDKIDFIKMSSTLVTIELAHNRRQDTDRR